MNYLDEYHVQEVAQDLPALADFKGKKDNENPPLFIPVLRRWKMVLLTFIIIAGSAVPLIWFVVKPLYQATAAIKVVPVVSSILLGDEKWVPMYKNFMYTQADLIASDPVLQRVADDLANNELFFQTPENSSQIFMQNRTPPDLIEFLRSSIGNSKLLITPEDNTELIKIIAKNPDSRKAVVIADAFARAYMTMVSSEDTKDEDQKLAVLENELKNIQSQIEREKQTLHEMTKEYGTDALTTRQDIKLQRVAALQSKLTDLEIQKISLNVKIKIMENSKKKNIGPQDLLRLRYEFTNADLTVKALTANVAVLEQELVVAYQQLAPTNMELRRKEEVLKTIKERLELHRQDVGKKFDEMVANEYAVSDKEQLNNTKNELTQAITHENEIRSMLAKEDSETVALGRKQLAIQEMQDKLGDTKKLYEKIQKRMDELNMERKRPARTSVAYFANSALLEDKRPKLSFAAAFAALGLGMLLALIKDRIDRSIKTPNDVERIGVRIIGTTSRNTQSNKQLAAQQYVEDYHSICTNIGLFGENGIPKKLVISSPGPKEGKTTLAINLASSLAKRGRNILLIDGDLRKPDIAKLLKLKEYAGGLQKLLAGKKFGEVVCPYSSHLSILTADPCDQYLIYRLIAQDTTAKFINIIGQDYDHIIIDAPPVLVVSDALLWAKIADAVLLTSFAGSTESQDLKICLDRFKLINVNVLGTVLHNVAITYSYNSYKYNYYDGKSAPRKNSCIDAPLLPVSDSNACEPDAPPVL